MARRFEGLQGLVDQLFLIVLQLLFEFANFKVLARYAAEEGLFSTLGHHLNVLEISRLCLNFDHLVERGHNLDAHGCSTALCQKLVQE